MSGYACIHLTVLSQLGHVEVITRGWKTLRLRWIDRRRCLEINSQQHWQQSAAVGGYYSRHERRSPTTLQVCKASFIEASTIYTTMLSLMGPTHSKMYFTKSLIEIKSWKKTKNTSQVPCVMCVTMASSSLPFGYEIMTFNRCIAMRT